MTVAIDATVVRAPLSGVGYAVRGQTLALIAASGQRARPLVLATDPVIRAAAIAVGCPCPALPGRLVHPGWRILWQQTQLPPILRRERCEALLAMAYTAPLDCPVPYLLEVHDTIALRRPNLCSTRNALHLRTLMPPSIRGARWLVTAASAVAREVADLAGRPAADVLVAPLGLDDTFLQPPAPLPVEWVPLQPYILFVGNIEPKKGLDTLLAAYPCLDGSATLVLAGREGWKCRTLVRRLDGYTGPGRIVRLGYVPREQLPALYAAAAAAVLPSVEEGFGLPVLEALAMGTPIVHSDHPVLLETASGHGLVFPVGDEHALAAVLRHALTGPRPSADARAWASAHTWRRWADAVATHTRPFP